MVLRASAPKHSAILSCARPKTRRKSLARNLPSLLAANAVIVFTGHLPAGEMLSFREETERRKTPAGALASSERSPPRSGQQVLFGPHATSKSRPGRRQNGGRSTVAPSPRFSYTA